jgi:hypothetical protein
VSDPSRLLPRRKVVKETSSTLAGDCVPGREDKLPSGEQPGTTPHLLATE